VKVCPFTTEQKDVVLNTLCLDGDAYMLLKAFDSEHMVQPVNIEMVVTEKI
jgi:hypothetical protein